jgi:hypothetical protein
MALELGDGSYSVRRKCKSCGVSISEESKSCTHCGEPYPFEDNKCIFCKRRTPKERKLCVHCGRSHSLSFTTATTRQDSTTGSTRGPVRPPKSADSYTCFQVQGRQGEMAVGRSLLANVLGGQPALIRCYFEVFDESGTIRNPVVSTEFLIYAGRSNSLEQLSGTDRSEAEGALRWIDNAMAAKSCRRIGSGPHWYSHRYQRTG